jgi:hypothetical protein
MFGPKIDYRGFVERTLATILFAAAGLKTRLMLSKGAYVAIGILRGRSPLVTLIEMELALAIWLWLGGLPLARFLCASAFFSMLAIVAFCEAFNALPTCGCFGAFPVPPIVVLIFDLGAVAVLWHTRTFRRREDIYGVKRGFLGTSMPMTMAIFALVIAHRAFSSNTADNSLVILDPDTWVNREFPAIGGLSQDSELKTGQWVLFFYHYNCDECLAAIPSYRALASSMSRGLYKTRLAFVAIPPLAPAGRDPVAASSTFVRLNLSSDHTWVASTPIAVALKDGRVLAVADGDRTLKIPNVFNSR